MKAAKKRTHSDRFDDKSSGVSATKALELPIIRCKCGAKILVLPDVKEMGKAIDEHAAACQLTQKAPDATQVEEEVANFLIAQVLALMSEKMRRE